MAQTTRLNFFNANRTLNPFLASLLSLGQSDRPCVTLAGRDRASNREAMTVHVRIDTLGGEDESGNNWFFKGHTLDGRPISGFIHLSDGNGFVEIS